MTVMLPRTIWSLWFQGWENAPPLVQACWASWQNHNQDWTLNALTRESLPTFLDDYPQLDPVEVASDLIRMELLQRFGGIWVDSTTYCLRPLDEWIHHAVSSGFFAFNRPGPDRMLASWFLAAQLGCRIIDIWHNDTLAYWNGRAERHTYYWLHGLFAQAYEREAHFKAIWDATPKLSADGPHCFVPSRETLFQPVGAFHRLVVETAQTPLLKLTHKLDHDKGIPGTAYRWMCDRMAV
jgi:hypothetical protein